MIVINARNVNDALDKGLTTLKTFGLEEESRNGPVIVMPEPVLTEYEQPCERVLFGVARDANPYFHLFEALAFLAGENRVAPYAHYAKRMSDYSDDGEHLHGAYGFRWLEWFGFDQLAELTNHLKYDPNSRRAVLTMWSPSGDLVASEGVGGIGMKDLPCNTQGYFRIRRGKLTTTIMARSNDAVWGAMGANAVHFSVLHEFMARAVGVQSGVMYQFSNDFHIYKSLPQFTALWESAGAIHREKRNPYEHQRVIPMFVGDERPEHFQDDCKRLLEVGPNQQFKTSFFMYVVNPMMLAHAAWRAEQDWRGWLEKMPACDWKTVGLEWLERRVGE